MKQKQFFLISFLPALAYWYLEENYSIKIALIGGISLGCLEMLLEWIFTKHIHTLSKFNFFLIVSLGSLSLFAGEGIWFKLQPFFTGLLMGTFLIYRYLKKDSLMLETMKAMGQKNIVEDVIILLERNLAFFLILYGCFMAYVALYESTDRWLFFKTAGFYIVSIVFFVGHLFYLRFKSRR